LLYAKCDAIEDGCARLWRGLKVFALDISALTLPEALWADFGSHKGSRGEGAVLSPIAVLYDLFMRIPVAFRMGRSDADERSLAKRLFKHLKPGSLLLIDAGFYSIEIFAVLERLRVRFLCPMRSNGRPHLIKPLGEDDGLYEIRRSDAFKNRAGAPKRMLVRIITARRRGWRPRRLVTSLTDSGQYPGAEITLLYHERWHIETFFREYKHTLKAQQFHAHTKKALYTEIIFQMLLCTLTRLSMADAARHGALKPGDLSFTKSLSQIKNILQITATLPIEKWPEVYEELIRTIATLKIDKRPGRAFERNRQKRRKKSRAARLAKLQRIPRNAA